MSAPPWLADAGRDAPWSSVQVCVAGVGTSGAAAARALLGMGVRVVVVDAGTGERSQQAASALEALGAVVRLGDGDALPNGTGLVVTSPGWRPGSRLFAAAADAGVPVWGEVELAWRLHDPAVPWLVVTGTNGKTTTVEMLASILQAAGLRALAAGNVGTPLTDVVLDPHPYDVLAVELSSFQLHWSESVRPQAATVLNLAADHIDWHGSFEEYAADKAKVLRGDVVAVVNLDDDWSSRLAAKVVRRVGFTLAEPPSGALGVLKGQLVERAGASGETVPLAAVDDVQPSAPHNVANALAAAALARAHGVPAPAVADGLRAFRPGAHRIAAVAERGGVTFVDDSKATNPHAAAASLESFDHVVWIAGGLAKGATFDELVQRVAGRLRAAVLLGVDRGRIRDALARHAPQIPVVEVVGTETDAMDAAVREAARLAVPGDTVLLAPGCASMDIFVDYAARGDAFTSAARALAGVAS